jgi:hypothetical protein
MPNRGYPLEGKLFKKIESFPQKSELTKVYESAIIRADET